MSQKPGSHRPGSPARPSGGSPVPGRPGRSPRPAPEGSTRSGHVFLCFMGVAILIGSHTSFGTIAGCGLLLVDCLWAVAELFWIATSKDGTLL